MHLETLNICHLKCYWQYRRPCDWPVDVCIIAAPGSRKEGDWGSGREMHSGAWTSRQNIFSTHLVAV